MDATTALIELLLLLAVGLLTPGPNALTSYPVAPGTDDQLT